MHYLPLPPTFIALLGLILLILAALIQIGALRYAYSRLGLRPGAVFVLLLASLLGSYINFPLFQLPEQRFVSGRVVSFFGMSYVVPTVVDWPATIVAINLGGAVVPALLSLYLLAHRNLWLRGFVAIACVTAVTHVLATPTPGIGIAVPVFIPPLVSVLVSCLVSWREAAPLAYVSGSIGTLIGADLMNLGKIQGLGAPVASIGGAGTFDGVFLSGVLAVLMASLFVAPAPDLESNRRA